MKQIEPLENSGKPNSFESNILKMRADSLVLSGGHIFISRSLRLLWIIAVFFTVSCGGSKKVWKEQEIEIAPGKFITIKKYDRSVDDRKPGFKGVVDSFYNGVIREGEEYTELQIPWKGKTIHWGTQDIVVSLMEFEDNLYMIGFNRESIDPKTKRRQFRYVYYKLMGDTFVNIPSSEYPKSIAIQNMWFHDYERSMRDLNRTLELNPENKYFYHTITANIWLNLINGTDSLETSGTDVEKMLFIEFVKTYHPVRLTEIVRKKTTKAEPGKLDPRQTETNSNPTELK